MAIFKTTLSQASSFINAVMRQMADDKIPGEPVMLHSSPGVGKSALIHQIGADNKEMFEAAFNAKFKIWDVRVGSQQESDIQGIPYPVTVDVVDGLEVKDMMFSTPSWWPREGECGILLLDELANAPIPNQQACYRVTHDRSIHNGRTLPPGVMILAAGNLKEDKTGAKGIIPALARRFQAHFFIQPSVEDFVTYAMKNKLSSGIIGFLSYDHSKIVGKAIDGEYGFACPANYESVSKILNNRYMTQDEKEMGILSGLGSVVGQDFIGFLRNEKWLPNWKEVEDTGQYKVPQDASTDRGIMFTIISATAVRILGQLQDPDYDPKKTDNLASVLREFDTSTAGIAFRSMKRADKSALGKVLTGGSYKQLRGILDDVLTRTDAMSKG